MCPGLKLLRYTGPAGGFLRATNLSTWIRKSAGCKCFHPVFFFQWSNPPNSEKSGKFWTPKKTQKMGSFGKWLFQLSFWVSRNGTRALHDTNHAKARRCSYRVNLDTKKLQAGHLWKKMIMAIMAVVSSCGIPLPKKKNSLTSEQRSPKIQRLQRYAPRSLTPGCSWNDPTWSNHTFVPPSCSIDRVSPISFEKKKKLIPSVSSRLLCTCAYTCVVE